MKDRIRAWVKRHYDLYDLSDIQTWGHCGLCGKAINDEPFPKDWAWGICKECLDSSA